MASNYVRLAVLGRPGIVGAARYFPSVASKCSADGCQKYAQNTGVLCRAHWREKTGIQPAGTGGPKERQQGRTCKGPECNRPCHSKGYCLSHYKQWRGKGRVWALGSRTGRAAHSTCMAYGCGSPDVVQWGFCAAHAVQHLGECVIHWCAAPVRVKRNGLCDKHARQNTRFRHFYGIGILDRYRMAEEQNHMCATCSAPDIEGSLHVDHCHDTGEVRGLLCGNCNRAIGLFENNPAALRAAADYLERARGVD